jgi:endo-1,4-beta-xylanase
MKTLYKLALTGILAVSCTKYDPLKFAVDKPENIALQEDIDAYPALKTYINRAAHPNFKLGMALSLNSYVNKDVGYRLANRNFDEIALGYEMKHGAVVQSDGTLRLDNIEKLIETAKAANMSVYGHTLAWHANQNAAYLNSLIEPLIIPGEYVPTWELVTKADFETSDASNFQANDNAKLSFTAAGGGAGGSGRALKITNESVRANDWDAQFFIKFSPAVKVGDQIELSMDVKAGQSVTFPSQAHVVPFTYKHWDFFGSITAGTSWSKFTKQITVTADQATAGAIAFNLGAVATDYYFDNITVKRLNEKGGGVAGYAYTFTNPTKVNFWEAQVAYDLAAPLQNAKEYILKFAVKSDKAGTIRAEVQSSSDYSSNSFGTFNLSPEWNEYELKVTTSQSDRNRLVISYGDFAGKVLIDNISLTASGSSTNLVDNGDFENGTVGKWTGWGNSSTRDISQFGQGYGGIKDQIIHKTEEEKKSLITAALDTWISGMMTVTKSHVKAWDVVNEPMDDGKPYELKTAAGRATIAADEFFWQDYLGKDYAVTAFNLARKYGNPDDKLFINDYNLEYNLDKCKGIIEYTKYIESKGAKVDGIGTQMHIDIKSDKSKIQEMLRLLAATGKLVKISELDIGLGAVKTENATAAQYQDQAEMYKFVIDKYFELIPAAQRYGITIWSPMDSPEESSWRAGEPVGIWTEGYVRKLAYSYVAEALKANTEK